MSSLVLNNRAQICKLSSNTRSCHRIVDKGRTTNPGVACWIPSFSSLSDETSAEVLLPYDLGVDSMLYQSSLTHLPDINDHTLSSVVDKGNMVT